MKYIRKHLLISLLLLISVLSGTALMAEQESKRIIISEIRIEIDGNTRADSLLTEINLHEGKEFDTYEDLIDYTEKTKQDLINMRVFEQVEFHIEKISESEEYSEYLIQLKVRDTITFYPIPYPKYNSNTKFRLGLKFYYYNAFGTMTDWFLFSSIDINDEFDEWAINSWHITPFVEGIDLLGLDFRAEYSHKFIMDRPENKIDTYHNDSISFGTKFFLPNDFYYSMDPRLSFSYDLNSYSKDPVTDEKTLVSTDPLDNDNVDTMRFSWIHTLGYDSLNWIGNFRHGFSSNLENNLTVSSDLDPSAPAVFSTGLKGDAKYFWRINNRINISTMATGLISYNRELVELGYYLRGVRDDELSGYKALFWSFDVNLSVLDWDGVAEAQLRPFFNIGGAWDENNVGKLSYGAGADFVLYIDKLNAIQARGTVAVDLSRYDWSDGDKYEIEIDTSVSY